jgi:hypothetical protein
MAAKIKNVPRKEGIKCFRLKNKLSVIWTLTQKPFIFAPVCKDWWFFLFMLL